ncbi:hypothetical protein BC830DRAFT_1107507 [Chytriomyces sp. MP71]|nr:hypothetical protein BC830DRAFT_1107507 [Chytriomyces sp. MP71]
MQAATAPVHEQSSRPEQVHPTQFKFIPLSGRTTAAGTGVVDASKLLLCKPKLMPIKSWSVREAEKNAKTEALS